MPIPYCSTTVDLSLRKNQASRHNPINRCSTLQFRSSTMNWLLIPFREQVSTLHTWCNGLSWRVVGPVFHNNNDNSDDTYMIPAGCSAFSQTA